MSRDYSLYGAAIIHHRMAVTSLNEVESALTGIIERCRDSKSRIAYFAALYRRVTRSLKQALAAGKFEHAEFMQHLGVIFANRYLDALKAFESNAELSRCWAITFRAASNNSLLVLEHLTAG